MTRPGMMWRPAPHDLCEQCECYDSNLSRDTRICADCAEKNAEAEADYARVLESYADDEREAA